MYTYPTAILAPFAYSQVIQVIVAHPPSEQGMRGLQGAVLAFAYLLEHLKILDQGVPLEEEARKLATKRKTSMQLIGMILLRGCRNSMWEHHILVIGELLRRKIRIALWNGLTLVGTSFSGPTLKQAYGKISTTLESV
jgi:hypothetical protein